jgi:hypothetical protein
MGGGGGGDCGGADEPFLSKEGLEASTQKNLNKMFAGR